MSTTSFQEFREKHSTDDPQIVFASLDAARTGGLEKSFYIVPNERQIQGLARAVTDTLPLKKPDAYVGIIGGVDANLRYIFALQEAGMAQNIPLLLTDINEHAIDHLAFYIYCMQGIKEGNSARNLQSFLENVEEKKIDRDEISELFGETSEGETIKLERYQSRIRKGVAKKMRGYYFQQRQGTIDDWLQDPERFVNAVREGQLRAFRGDLFRKGGIVVKKELEKAKSKRPVFYFSNTLDKLRKNFRPQEDAVEYTLSITDKSFSALYGKR